MSENTDENVPPRLGPLASKKGSRRPPTLDLSSAEVPKVQISNRKKKVVKYELEQESASTNSWAALSRRGKGRSNREDSYAAHPLYIPEPGDEQNLSLFCVFDGHGGDRASKYCRVRVPILFSAYLKEDVNGEVVPALEKAFDAVHKELVQDIVATDDNAHLSSLLSNPGQSLLRTWTALGGNDTTTDPQQPAEEDKGEAKGHCGTTATAVVIGRDEVTVVHVGDTRAVAARAPDAEPMPLCRDHRPGQEDESDRITESGGLVLRVGGADRVNGVLAVSRSLGHDGDIGKHVIPTPEINCHDLDELGFLVIASDGLWDAVGESESISMASQALAKKGPAEAALSLCDAACAAGATDDVTVLVVDLSKFGGAKLDVETTGEDISDSHAPADREDVMEVKPPTFSSNPAAVSGTPRHGARKMMW